MNTKSALIIAVAIVIGFSIEPILDRENTSDPRKEVVVFDREEGVYVAGEFKWFVRKDGSIGAEKYSERFEKTLYFSPADKESARIGLQLVKD